MTEVTIYCGVWKPEAKHVLSQESCPPPGNAWSLEAKEILYDEPTGRLALVFELMDMMLGALQMISPAAKGPLLLLWWLPNHFGVC